MYVCVGSGMGKYVFLFKFYIGSQGTGARPPFDSLAWEPWHQCFLHLCHVFISENTVLNKKNICDHTLSPYLKNDLSPTTKMFKELHTDNVWGKVFFRMRRVSNYEIAVFLG